MSLSLIDTGLSVLLKLLTLSLFISGVMIWKYLTLIGWPGLFLQSVGNTNSLMSILVLGAVLSVCLLIIGIAPSWLLILTRSMIRPSYTTKGAASHFPIFAFVVWMILTWSLSFYSPNVDIPWLIVFSALFLSLMYVRILREKFKDHLLDTANSTELEKDLALLGIVGLVLGACLLSSLPMQFAFVFIDTKAEDWGSVLAVLSLTIIAGVSLFPGYCFYKFGEELYQSKKLLCAISVALVPLIWIALFQQSVNFFVCTTMRKIGVYNVSPNTYSLLDEKTRGMAYQIGLTDREGENEMRAYPIFDFGDIQVLCKHQYDPTNGKLFEDKYPIPEGPCALFKRDEARLAIR